MRIRIMDSLFGVLGLWLLLAGAAHAHPALTGSVPADGETISQPERLAVNFNQPVRLLRLDLVSAGEEAVDFGFSPVPEARDEFAYELPALSSGAYRVEWVAIGSDGHRVEESFGFIVERE